MEPFTTARGPAAWLPEPNVDTDVIIRIERITQ
ncbi:MAG: 3-isopropylmalate dehydratase small subunit, partial [Novosphingobium sp.]|nr:3-isopropylmalate dehydratase small subunit [Novosphingobium sp.]